MQCDYFLINDLVMFGYAWPSHLDPDYRPWYMLFMLPVTNLKHDLTLPIRNMCHYVVSLDWNEAWHIINSDIYWKWNTLSNVMPKVKYFPKTWITEMKLKKGRLLFNQRCNFVYICNVNRCVISTEWWRSLANHFITVLLYVWSLNHVNI